MRIYSPLTSKWFFIAFLAVVLVPWSGLPTLASPAKATEKPHSLEQGRNALKQVVGTLQKEKQALRRTKGEEKSLLAELESLDRKLSSGKERLDTLTQKLKDAEDRLPLLEDRVGENLGRLSQSQEELAAHLRLLYGLGDQGLLKVALSGEKSARIQQGVVYFGHLIRERNRRFQGLRLAQDELQKSIALHQETLSHLQQLTQDLKDEHDLWLSRREERIVLLKRVQKEGSLRQQKLAELKKAQEDLSGFVVELGEALNRAPVAKTQTFGRIQRKKGKLPRPVKGAWAAKSSGLFFKVREGSPVKAVFQGQVVYADWFRGYGLLLIVNHGNHIYSLYGHNRRLLVGQGDWIAANQKIAEVGDTGSMEGVAGLYFEIRRNGHSDKPGRWLASLKK
ncbi:MAG: peptidoglycan DD-metalloendopeptidase family protein [Magnetococcales bacterium]|nr:peptidoglycan DD-metalloendopeptidase family protein [Magnetococcales bacterium]